MNPKAKRIPDVGRWSTIIIAVVFAAVISLARIAGELDSASGIDFRELIRDLLWMLSGAWFLANVLRVLDTMKPSISRVLSLVSLGAVAIGFSSIQLVWTFERGIPVASNVQNLALVLYGFAIGIIALVSVFRHGMINNPGRILDDATRWSSMSLDVKTVFEWLIRILAHLFKSIRRDPIRWSAIAAAIIWPTAVSPWIFPALLVQGIAITCVIRYADTYIGQPKVRIAALAIAVIFIWFNFAATVPFEPSLIAWLGPSLVLWTGSAVSAMFRPLTNIGEAVRVDDALTYRLDGRSDLDSCAVQ